LYNKYFADRYFVVVLTMRILWFELDNKALNLETNEGSDFNVVL
jgi:hypothetical protein